MCSNRWAVPEIPVHSSTPPARKCVTNETVGAPGRRRNRNVIPLGRTCLTTARRSPSEESRCWAGNAAAVIAISATVQTSFVIGSLVETEGGEGNLPLAMMAERRRAQVDRVRGHEPPPAAHARLPSAAVHLQFKLKPSGFARAGAVIAHSRARGRQRAGEHVADRRRQGAELHLG